MNMFKHLFATALIAYGLGLWFGHPEDWKWPDVGGAYLVNFVSFCSDFRPFSVVLCLFLALALFMLRKQY